MKEQIKKQAIEEMAHSVCRLEKKPENCASCMWKASCENYLSADNYYTAGYHKQVEGKWRTVVENKDDIVTECSACKKHFWFMKKGQLNIDKMPYCPNCGAKMLGGDINE